MFIDDKITITERSIDDISDRINHITEEDDNLDELIGAI